MDTNEIPDVITEEYFTKSTGCNPIDDDLERCNCPLAGDIGHSTCGWNKENNKPQFYIGPQYSEKTNKAYGTNNE